MTLESLERSARSRRTLSNSSTTSTPSSGSAKTLSSANLTGNQLSTDQGRQSSSVGESAKGRRPSSMGKTVDEDGIEDCDETTPFTTSSVTKGIQQHQRQDQPDAALTLPLLPERDAIGGSSHAPTSDLMTCPATSSASDDTPPILSGHAMQSRVRVSDSEAESSSPNTYGLCLKDGKCADSSMTSLVLNSDGTPASNLNLHKSADTSSTLPFLAHDKDSLRDGPLEPRPRTVQKRQLVTLINTPAPELIHVHLPSEIDTDPQPAITVIAIDPESGTGLYSPKPTSFVYPGFTPIAVSATTSSTVSDSPAPPGIQSPASQSGVRAVCGACGGVMPPPGTAFHLEGVGASVVGVGSSVGLTPTNAILLTNRAQPQNIPTNSSEPKNSVGVVCESVVMVHEEGPADSTIRASSTSTSLHTSTGTPGNVDICRICHCEGELDAPLIAPCYCTGSLRWVHQSCLQQWIKSSETRKCELCKFEFIMETKIKPFQKWEKLQMTTVERRKIMCSVTFHAIAITCVIWSLYVLIDRTTDEIRKGNLEWPFWTKLIVVAIGFIGGLVFMYVQFKMYIALCRRWRAFNRVIYVQDIPDALLTSSKEKLKASGLLTSKAARTGGRSSTSVSPSASKEDSPDLAAASDSEIDSQIQQHQPQLQEQPPPPPPPPPPLPLPAAASSALQPFDCREFPV